MRLLTYQWQHPNCSVSGPGWDWDNKLELFDNDDELKDAVNDLRKQIADERERWEKADPKWRDPTFIPPIRHIRIYNLEPCNDPQFLEFLS